VDGLRSSKGRVYIHTKPLRVAETYPRAAISLRHWTAFYGKSCLSSAWGPFHSALESCFISTPSDRCSEKPSYASDDTCTEQDSISLARADKK
jgi:hypothetical protein